MDAVQYTIKVHTHHLTVFFFFPCLCSAVAAIANMLARGTNDLVTPYKKGPPGAFPERRKYVAAIKAWQIGCWRQTVIIVEGC